PVSCDYPPKTSTCLPPSTRRRLTGKANSTPASKPKSIEPALEFKACLKGNHAGCVVTTQPNPQQAGGRGGGISKRPEPRLRARLSRNSGQNAAGESKIRMVEHVEELPFQPQLNV